MTPKTTLAAFMRAEVKVRTIASGVFFLKLSVHHLPVALKLVHNGLDMHLRS